MLIKVSLLTKIHTVTGEIEVEGNNLEDELLEILNDNFADVLVVRNPTVQFVGERRPTHYFSKDHIVRVSEIVGAAILS